MKRVKGAATPVRAALRGESSLRALVQDRLGAVKTAHRNHFDEGTVHAFDDSLDLDAAMLADHSRDNRWDYLLGHGPSGEVVALEPHSAKDDQIQVVIKKREAALLQLRDHLRPGARVARWIWVSDKDRFSRTDKARITLDQHGISFAGRRILEKHLPAPSARTTSLAASSLPSNNKRPKKSR